MVTQTPSITIVALHHAHDWLPIRLGRVCSVCMTAQGHDEFNDEVVCSTRRTVNGSPYIGTATLTPNLHSVELQFASITSKK